MAALTQRALELRREKGTLVKENTRLLEESEKANRALGAEDQAQYDARWAKIEELTARIADLDRQAAAEAEAEKVLIEDRNQKAEDPPKPDAEVRAFGRFLAYGREGLGEAERRALNVTSDSAGGYLQAPEQFVAQLIQAVDNAVHIRRLATTYQIPQAESLGAPSLSADPADPTWTTELAVGDEDSTMAFGKRNLHPHPLAQYIKVSNTLLRKAAIGAEGIVRDRLAYKMGVVQENAFLNGTGASQPLGVFVASANGISTGRDASTGNSATAIGADGLIEAKYTLKANYWPRATWLFHRDAVKMIAKLKDGEGQYLWQPGLQPGQADRILGLPFLVSEYAPNTFTSALYVGILGDFSHYWIADALSMQVQRLVELYAATNQTGFITRSETDGMPVLEEAFVRVKLG
jgi:HK97 family phage major capsid protein